ncbi:MAG TPA: hypothetical protein VKE51_22385 [Vicinamibacterales bacterium]|nr:hypothetical protein [Vicinamibacterales bacterium]
MTAVVLLALSLPCTYAPSADGRATLASAGVTRLCAEADLAQREPLPTPGTAPRAGLASPTRAPWIVANGWRFARHPGTKYLYDLPAGKAALAAAEAYAYGADAALKIDPADARPLGEMLKFLEALPPVDLPAVSDLGIVDDGSAVVGEVMNLLARRNLLFEIVQAPSPRYRITIRIGAPGFPREEAADPSAFALKIRRQLTDDQRTLRVYGSEVVICRLTADARRARVHLLNYSGREIEGLRIRLRGAYPTGDARVAGVGALALQDRVVAGGATEFSLPRLTTYAVVDLTAAR